MVQCFCVVLCVCEYVYTLDMV